MTKEQIQNTPFFISLSGLNNSQRGVLFDRHSREVEKALSVRLVSHSYTDLGNISSENAQISYQDNFRNIIGIMEFVPIN